MIGGSSPFSTEEQLSRHLNDSYGLRNLKPEWLSRQRASLQSSPIRTICNIDIREISQGSLPWRLQDAHSVLLGVKVLVQIDEVINVGAPDPKSPSPRLLQFALTDGTTSFVAIEIDPSKSSFSTDTVPGTKVVLLPSALVRRGRLLLSSTDYTLLGTPQRSARISGNSDAVPSAGSVRPRESAASNIGGSSGVRSLNRATNITNVGGIAAITQSSDDGGDHDGLWSENPTDRSRYSAPIGERMSNSAAMRISGSRIWEGSVRRNRPSVQEPSNANNMQARRHGRAANTLEREAGLESKSRFQSNQQTVSPVHREPSAIRNGSAIREGAEREEVTFRGTAQVPSEVSRPAEAEVEILGSETREPMQRLERINIVDEYRLVHLSHLTDGVLSFTRKPHLCRLYAVKTGKRMEYQLTRGGVNSTVVDDGTSVKVVTLSNELVENLHTSVPEGNEDQDIRRSLRSICGFVQVEYRNKAIVATSYIYESPVSSTMLSNYLDEVTTRYAIYSG